MTVHNSRRLGGIQLARLGRGSRASQRLPGGRFAQGVAIGRVLHRDFFIADRQGAARHRRPGGRAHGAVAMPIGIGRLDRWLALGMSGAEPHGQRQGAAEDASGPEGFRFHSPTPC